MLDDAVSKLDARDAGADLDDLAGSVGAGLQRQPDRSWGDAVLDLQDVAVVQRDGPDPNAHLTRPEIGAESFLDLEPVDAERVREPPGSHRARSAR